ncbi:MAG: hypothetical protein IAF02_25075 [Anaerolineae bacterium]|nr:hypothetical protein [Anaerolineae bacterium]
MTLYNDVLRQADKLTSEEQLRLITYLAEQARKSVGSSPMPRRWHEIRGAAAYPLMDEDAQNWVSRTREASDTQRGQSWQNQE